METMAVGGNRRLAWVAVVGGVWLMLMVLRPAWGRRWVCALLRRCSCSSASWCVSARRCPAISPVAHRCRGVVSASRVLSNVPPTQVVLWRCAVSDAQCLSITSTVQCLGLVSAGRCRSITPAVLFVVLCCVFLSCSPPAVCDILCVVGVLCCFILSLLPCIPCTSGSLEPILRGCKAL